MKELLTPVDMERNYTTGDGTNVRILVVIGPGPYPVIGIRNPVNNEGGDLMRWTRRGRSSLNSMYDLEDANPRPIDIAREVAREFAITHSDDPETSYETCAIRIVAELEHRGFIKVR